MAVTEIIKNGHQYEVELGTTDAVREKGNAKIKIGGVDVNKFVPTMHSSKWDEEAFLEIIVPENVQDEIEVFKNGIIELTIGDVTWKYYKNADEALSFEVVLLSRPPKISWTFQLAFSPSLVFHHQGTLEDDWNYYSNGGTRKYWGCTTLAEFLAISRRPENIVNSYAVYYNKKNNKYLTGKFCHIERPKLVDALGATTYAVQEIIVTSLGTAEWTITCDRDWLRNATYPVVIDPVVGYNSIGGSSTEPGEVFFGGRYACPSAGDIDDIQVYAEKTGGAPIVRMGVYEDNGGTVASQDLLTANESEISLPANPAWMQDSGITGALPADDIWLCVATDGAWMVYYDTSTAGYDDTEAYWSFSYADAMPDPAPSEMEGYALELSFYANYTETGAGEDYIEVLLSSVNILDTEKRSITFKRIISAAVNLSENIRRLITFKRIMTAGIDIVDINRRISAMKRLIYSQLGINENAKRQIVFKRYIFADVGIEENNSAKRIMQRIMTSSMGIYEQVKRAFVFNRMFYDTVGIGESIQRKISLKRIIFEAVNLVDNINKKISTALKKVISESINVLSIIKKKGTFKRVLTEAVDITSIAKRSIIFIRNITSGVALLELNKKTFSIIKRILENEKISDTTKRKIDYKRFVASGVSLFDSNIRNITTTIKILVNELINISEVIDKRLSTSIKKIISESIFIYDDATAKIFTAFKKIISEAIAIYDICKRSISFKRVFLEAIDVGENISKKASINKIIHAVVALSDVLIRKLVLKRAMLSSMVITDGLLRRITYKRILSSVVDITSNINRRLTTALVKIIEDTVTIIDGIQYSKIVAYAIALSTFLATFTLDTLKRLFHFDNKTRSFTKDNDERKFKP